MPSPARAREPEEENGGRRLRAEQFADEIQRGDVRPLHVIEDEDEEVALPREAGENTRQQAMDARAASHECSDAGREGRPPAREFGHEIEQESDVVAEGMSPAGGERFQRLRRRRQRADHQRAQGGSERRIGLIARLALGGGEPRHVRLHPALEGGGERTFSRPASA